MLRPNSLSFRVAFAFACFGAFFSFLLSASLYYVIENISHDLMDQTLQSELDQSITRQQRGSGFIPPASASIIGFISTLAPPDPNIPERIASLPNGNFNVTIEDTDYRVLVADNDGYRYFMLFNTELEHARENELRGYLFFATIILTLLSAAGGYALAVHIVNPLWNLAEQVSHAGPNELNLDFSNIRRDDEVGELACAFDRYLGRLRLFIERERIFTADMSHELRTPLSIILGSVEVLEQDPNISDVQKRLIARIKRAVKDSKELSNALLLLAREKPAASDEQTCDVTEVIKECIDKHHYLIEGNPVKLEVEFNGHPCLDTERALLETVIGNLVRNAFSYTRSGSVKIVLESDRLIVKDTGIGIRNEDKDNIFLPHYRGEASTGAGIGLSLVKRICDRNNWFISIRGREEKGTIAEVVFLQHETN